VTQYFFLPKRNTKPWSTNVYFAVFSYEMVIYVFSLNRTMLSY
jgi:hypothetical protein